MSEWISVKDRLPEQNQQVLMIDKDKCMYVAVYARNHAYYEPGYFDVWDTGHCCDREPAETIYWMPLPEPPKIDCAEHGHDWVRIPLGDGPDCRRCGAHG